jgi:hypothetical protein
MKGAQLGCCARRRLKAGRKALVKFGDKKVMTDKPANGFEPEIIAFCCEH